VEVDMVKCLRCGASEDTSPDFARVASISGSIAGDEYIESLYYCDRCECYTIEAYHDRFLGEETVTFEGPFDKAKGDALAAVIAACPEPWNKKCRCPSHQEYFGNCLD
jgi:hypothetical protein